MEGKRISQLTPDTNPTIDDYIVTVDGSTTQNKRVELGSLPVSTAQATEIGAKVSKAGDTMTGNLIIPAPTQPTHATTRSYVDNRTPIYGTGFPQGVVTAPVGTTYVDTAATNGAIEWKKATGTGNTGWVVSVGDTGWRNVISLINGPLNPEAEVRVRRIGNNVLWAINAIYTPSTNYELMSNLPEKVGFGFLPTALVSALLTGYGSPSITRGVAIGRNPGEGIKLVGSGNFWVAPDYATTENWPNVLPGTPF